MNRVDESPPVTRLTALRGQVLDAAQAAGLDVALPAVGLRTIAITGAPGAGKSTLTRTLLGIHPAHVPEVPDHAGVSVEYVPGGADQVFAEVGGPHGQPSQWVRVRDELPRGARLVRVTTTQVPLLTDLWLRVLDTGAEPLPETLGDDPVVIHVTPGRGRTEDDELVLAALRRYRVAVVQNIRDDELTPARSDVEAGPAAGTALGHVVPLVLATAGRKDGIGGGEAERAVLMLVIARLLDDDQTRITADELSRAAFQRQARLREDHANRMARVYRTARHRALDSVLGAVADLTRMVADRSVVEAVDTALNRVIAHPKVIAAASAAVADELHAAVSRLVGEYNVYAFTRGARSAGTGPRPQAEMAGSYVRVREELLGWLDNVGRAGALLALTDGERAQFAGHRALVESNRVEVALLGQFSAGKSALVNAILGFDVNDKERTFLPTSRAVETAIVTRVVHADRPSASATWLPAVSLRFFEELGGDVVGSKHSYRVREQEIDAFLRWLDSGEADLADCVLLPAAEGRVTTGERVRALRAWRRATPTGTPVVYAKEHRPEGPCLPDGPVITKVEVRRFRRAVPATWPHSTELDEVFDAAKCVEHALRMAHLQVGHPHEFLRHVTFLDTPGTDAPIPHHRATARGIVGDRSLPVIYCFPAVHAGTNADRENLAYLGSKGVGNDLARFFFVITQQGAVARTEWHQVRGTVHQLLDSLSIAERKLYFTEVLAEHNDEFRELVADLGRFIKENRSALVGNWIDDAEVLIRTVRDRAEQGLNSIDASAADKRDSIARLTAEQAALARIAAGFETEDKPWAGTRLCRILADGPGRITDDIAALSGKDELTAPGMAAALDTAISGTDIRVRARVEHLRSGLVARITARIADELPARTMTSHDSTIPDALFGSAAVHTAVEDQVWRPFYRRGWGGKKKDTEANQERIARAWRLARDSGDATARDRLDDTITHLTAEFQRISEAIAADLDTTRSPVESKHGLLAARAEADRWIGRLSVLRNRYQRSQAE